MSLYAQIMMAWNMLVDYIDEQLAKYYNIEE